MQLSTELEKRGFIHQFSGESLATILDAEKRVVYHGIDPSADSAHAGNFVIWMLLKHLGNAGHKIIFLVGGGTGMIGDPKTDMERPTVDPVLVAKNVEKIKTQAKRLLEGIEVEFVNNADWLAKLNLIEFLRDTGKNFTINELIKKEAIASRLNSENGISYTEFAYPLLQAYDYLVLHRNYGCDLQVGGSDQWGNMIAGTDLIRRKEGKVTHVATVPLIIDKTTGKKFGKSEGNAVWLDAEKTSPYQFYQFWLNTADENVFDYLKLYTLLSLESISELTARFQQNPGAREAQAALAYEVTKIVHGAALAEAVKKVSTVLFGSAEVTAFSPLEKELILNNAPVLAVREGVTLVDVLVESELASSKREARTFVEAGASTINGEKVEDLEYALSQKDCVSGLLLLKRGKKQLRVITIE